jgi:hypothetical protein
MKIVAHQEFDADGTAHSTFCVVCKTIVCRKLADRVVEQVEDNKAGRQYLFHKYNQATMENGKWCGNPNCSCSTGIHGGLTFGSGQLDEHGYWTRPCRVCAAASDAKSKETVQEVQSEFPNANVSWAKSPAWPFVFQDVKQLGQEIEEHNNRRNQSWEEFEKEFDYEL